MTDHGRDARHQILEKRLENVRGRQWGDLSPAARIAALEIDVEAILRHLLGEHGEGDRTTGSTGT